MKLCKKCNHKMLIENGFNKYGSNRYVMKVPLHKYNKHTIIELDITIELNERIIDIEVLDLCNNNIYIPYYNNEYSKHDKVCKRVNKKVKKIIKNLILLNIICE